MANDIGRATPFRPSFGAIEGPELIGRDGLVGALTQQIVDHVNSSEFRLPESHVLFGPRGSGKTATLIEQRDSAVAQGFITLHVQARGEAPIGTLIAREIARVVSRLDASPKPPKWLVALQIGVPSIAQLVIKRRDDPASLNESDGYTALQELCEFAKANANAVVLSVDEMQNARLADLGELAFFVQGLVDWDKVPFYFRGAALPHVSYTAMNNKRLSYFKRCTHHALEPLSDVEAHRGFKVYARSGGGEFKPDALREAVAAVDGSPYKMQLIGHNAWRASEAPERAINLADVQRGVLTAEREYERAVARLTLDDFNGTEEVAVQHVHHNDGAITFAMLRDHLAAEADVTDAHAERVIDNLVVAQVLSRHLVADREGPLDTFSLPPGNGLPQHFRVKVFGSPSAQSDLTAAEPPTPSRRYVGPRCNKLMPRLGVRCSRPRDHRGPCRQRA